MSPMLCMASLCIGTIRRSCAARHTFQRRPRYNKCTGGSRSLTDRRAAKTALLKTTFRRDVCIYIVVSFCNESFALKNKVFIKTRAELYKAFGFSL